jgi:hypothetical protein
MEQIGDHATPDRVNREAAPNAAAATITTGAKRRRLREPPSANAFAYTIRDAQAMGAPSRVKISNLEKEGKLRLIRSWGRTLVSGDSLRTLLGVTLTP